MYTNKPSPSPPTTTQTATKRLLKELSALHPPSSSLSSSSTTTTTTTTSPSPLPPHIPHLAPLTDSSLFHWTALLHGPPFSPYSSALFPLTLRIPATYPHAPPDVVFEPGVCHPNVNFTTGEICLDLLRSAWTPAYTLRATVDAVYDLLGAPEPDSPLNVDVACLLREGDAVGAEGLVRFFVGEGMGDGDMR